MGCALIKSTLGSGNPGRVGNLEGERTREQQGTKGTVYEQPGTEVDDSCHSWRVPSKWKQEQQGELYQGEMRRVYIYVNIMCLQE